MTMHMVHPSLTTINTSKKKKKLTAKQRLAVDQHNAWLKKNGVHIEQLANKNKNVTRTLKTTVSAEKTGLPCNNGFAFGGEKRSVFDSQWKRTYEDDPIMAAREATALRKAEELKSDLMPLYNKGPVQLKTRGTSLKDGNGRGK